MFFGFVRKTYLQSILKGYDEIYLRVVVYFIIFAVWSEARKERLEENMMACGAHLQQLQYN